MSELLTPNHRLLVIDDNPAIHQDFRKILHADDGVPAEMHAVELELFGLPSATPGPSIRFDLTTALTGQEGLKKLEESIAAGSPFALAFIDVRMPIGWDGIETASRICEKDPDIQIVLCTAFSDYSWSEMIDKIGQSERLLILKKPFDSIEVLQLAHALTEKWALRQTARARLEQLEQIVSERTRELRAANEQLKSEMAERTRVEDALRQAQKMEALGQLAGGVAHDFNNLLTVIRGYSQCLIAEGQTPTTLEALGQIDAAAERAANLTAQMLLFSRKKRLQPEYLNINEVIPQLGKMLRRLLGEHITMEFHYSELPLMIHADRAMIEQIVMNLAVNSRDAMPDGGHLAIRTEAVHINQEMARHRPKARVGAFACIIISDEGSGIPPESLPHLFEPFFTTKEPGKGTGLGLATVYGVVKQHDGWIDVQSEVGAGATFKVFLPLVSEVSAKTPCRDDADRSAAGGSETILLVEDEEAVRNLASKILVRHGYQVIQARSGFDALSIWEEQGDKIDLLLTDMVMPDGVSGWSLAQQLKKKQARLKIVYTTGYSLDAISHDQTLKEGLNFLPKPYDAQELVDTVRRCLDAGAGRWLGAAIRVERAG